jgi:site-specific recombinase XerC
MASVYKRRDDKARKGSSWYVAYADHPGKRRTVRGFTEKGLTQQLAVRLEDEARRIRLGLVDVDESENSMHWQVFEDNLQEFEKHLRCRDITDKQVQETMMRVRALSKFAGFTSANEITETEVESFLAKLREDGRSKQTSNHYLKAIKQLCRWLVRTKRIRHNPVADFSKLNVRTDQRHLRRALSAEELQLLVEAAREDDRVYLWARPRDDVHVGCVDRLSQVRDWEPDDFFIRSDQRSTNGHGRGLVYQVEAKRYSNPASRRCRTAGTMD